MDTDCLADASLAHAVVVLTLVSCELFGPSEDRRSNSDTRSGRPSCGRTDFLRRRACQQRCTATTCPDCCPSYTFNSGQFTYLDQDDRHGADHRTLRGEQKT